MKISKKYVKICKTINNDFYNKKYLFIFSGAATKLKRDGNKTWLQCYSVVKMKYNNSL